MPSCVQNLYFQPVVTCKEIPKPPTDDNIVLKGFWGYLYSYSKCQKVTLSLNSKDADLIVSPTNFYYKVKGYPAPYRSASLVFWGMYKDASYLFINNNSILSWETTYGLIIKEFGKSEESFSVNDNFFGHGYIDTEAHKLVFTYDNSNYEPDAKLGISIAYPNCLTKPVGITLGDSVQIN